MEQTTEEQFSEVIRFFLEFFMLFTFLFCKKENAEKIEQVEKVEKVESTEESASNEKSTEDQTEVIETEEVIVVDDDSSAEDDASEEPETPVEEQEEPNKSTSEIKPKIEAAEEKAIENTTKSEIIQNGDGKVVDDSEIVEDNTLCSRKESVDSNTAMSTKSEEEDTVVEQAPPTEPLKNVAVDQVDKGDVVEEKCKVTENPTTIRTVSSASDVENFEKRIENLNISSVSENRVEQKEKGIVEIRKIEKTEEKENQIYVVSSMKKKNILKIDVVRRRAH